MSLINEALKKAQKQRTGESPSLSSMPSIGGERASQIARRGGSTGLNTLLLRLGLGVVVLVALIVGAVVIFRDTGGDTPPTTIAAAQNPGPQPTATPPPTTTVASAPAPVAVAAVTPAAPAASNFVVPNVAPSVPEPATVVPSAPSPAPVQVNPPAIAVQTAAPVVEQPAAEPIRPAAPGKLEPRAINYIEGIRVAGIRASATDSKVLMNDRVYRLNDTVEHDLGLRLVGITSHSLTFEDDRGARYTRSF